METARLKKINLLPNVLTALGLTCGLYVIFKLNMTEVGEATETLLMATSALLILAGLFDILDGAVARAMGATSDFGGIFDSIADAVSFGVAPSVIVLKSMSVEAGTFESFLITISALVYSVCGIMRLVRFSVGIPREEELQKPMDANFTGLPIPAAGASIVSLNLFLISADIRQFVEVSESLRILILSFSMLFAGYLMVSRWKFPSMKRLHFRVRSFQVVFIIVLMSVMLFYGILHHFATVFFMLSWTYLTLGLTLSIIRLISGRKSKTLEDFELGPDEFMT